MIIIFSKFLDLLTFFNIFNIFDIFLIKDFINTFEKKGIIIMRLFFISMLCCFSLIYGEENNLQKESFELKKIENFDHNKIDTIVIIDQSDNDIEQLVKNKEWNKITYDKYFSSKKTNPMLTTPWFSTYPFLLLTSIGIQLGYFLISNDYRSDFTVQSIVISAAVTKGLFGLYQNTNFSPQYKYVYFDTPFNLSDFISEIDSSNKEIPKNIIFKPKIQSSI